MIVGSDELVHALKITLPQKLQITDITFACIGSDRLAGDSLGPLTGTYLKNLGYNVVSTLENTMNAMNLIDRLKEIPGDHTVIAIDACLGQFSSVGKFVVEKGSMVPGAGVGKSLTPVGDFHIDGIINAGGFMEYFVLANTRVDFVMDMAKEIVKAIQFVLPVISLDEVAASSFKNRNTHIQHIHVGGHTREG